MKSRTIAIFGVLTILLVLTAFGIWRYIESRPQLIPASNIQKLENAQPAAGSASEASKEFYKVTVPKGRWFDIGQWVRPWKYVNAISTGQPCDLMVGSTSTTARLMKTGIFNAVIVTTDNVSGGTDKGKYKGENIYQELAPVGDQGKIYLKLSDEATVDQVDVTIQIESVTSDDITFYRNQAQSWSSRHKQTLVLIGASTGAAVLFFIFGFIMGKRF